VSAVIGRGEKHGFALQLTARYEDGFVFELDNSKWFREIDAIFLSKFFVITVNSRNNQNGLMVFFLNAIIVPANGGNAGNRDSDKRRPEGG
jgi:hypothetical protein